MKYIRSFENIDKKFKAGDYVKIIPSDNTVDEIKDFLNNNVGIVYDQEYTVVLGKKIFFYNVKYKNVPEKLKNFTRFMGSQPPKGLKRQGEIFIADDDNSNDISGLTRTLRFATKEEIERQLLKDEADKYNL